MKKFVYIVIISLLLHTNVSYAMQQDLIADQTSTISINLESLSLAALCGFALGIIAVNGEFPYPKTIKKLYKIIFGKPALTPEKLAKKASSFATQTQGDVANYDIYQACEHGAIERVKELLQDPNLDINKPGSYQIHGQTAIDTPLHIACKKQHPKIIELLLLHKNIEVSKNALLLAYYSGRQYKRFAMDYAPIFLGVKLETVQKLLADQRVDINHKYANGKSILSLACENNITTLVKQLLQDSRIQYDNNLPLCYACKNENLEIVRLLLERNVNNCMNINECRARSIHENPLLIICSQIRQYDKDLKREEQYNAWQGIADKMMCFLLDETTSQKIQKIKIKRARCKEIFNLLLNDPAISIYTPENCVTALHLCTTDHALLSQLLSRTTQSINKLSSCSSLFNAYSSENQTPLHMAMIEGSLESILLLIEHGADITIKNKDGELPIKLLWQNAQKLLIFKTLLERNLIATKDLDENHCLVNSIGEPDRNNDNATARLLLELGANPNQQYDDPWEFSPLFSAAQNDLSLLNLCLDRYNGDYKQQNQRRETILYTAFMRKIVKHIHHINFLKKLDPQKRKEYMLYELESAACYDQRSVKQAYSSFGHYNREELKKDMDHFSLFLTKCIHFGNINITQKINNKSLLDIACENIQKELSCDILDKDKHHYKEVILHAFMRCVKPAQYHQLSDDLKVHYHLAHTYKENPYEYYRYLDLPKKITQQQYLRKQIALEVHHQPSNKTSSLRTITCGIF